MIDEGFLSSNRAENAWVYIPWREFNIKVSVRLGLPKNRRITLCRILAECGQVSKISAQGVHISTQAYEALTGKTPAIGRIYTLGEGERK